MSLRTALIGTMLFIGAATTGLIGVVFVVAIGDQVRNQEQERVNYDLQLAGSQYEQRLGLLARLIENASNILPPTEQDNLQESLARIKTDLQLTVLNVCDPDGRPLAGGYPELAVLVPLAQDPVLQRARDGQLSWSTELLSAERLRLEGGAALADSLLVRSPAESQQILATSSLFWWAACPIRDQQGNVTAIVYGGKALNHNLSLVDELRDLAFGTDTYDGKPLGTVTIFQDGLRVATNVLGPNGQRAIGTTVSDEVQQQVLGQGKIWRDRAWVVDAWYISGYKPLRNLETDPIGMLYVGLLESPYKDLRLRWIKQLLGLIMTISVIAVGVTIYIVRKITAPLDELVQATESMAEGTQNRQQFSTRETYAEIAHLTEAFAEMQTAIAERDQNLRQQNAELGETNEKLARVNRNYMESLGFVTHELKSPLAAMQTLLDVVAKGYAGPVSDKASSFLAKAKRSCLEMQEMVKNYLDLSRAERGELVPNMSEIELIADVVTPAVDQTRALFELRDMSLSVQRADQVRLLADPEMLRIALINLLSNASKYGRQGGAASVYVTHRDDMVDLTVQNEGNGFTPAERDALFEKFSRLKNQNTREQRGSGLGLFLCQQIAKSHGGSVQANSEPGAWAEFSISIPKTES